MNAHALLLLTVCEGCGFGPHCAVLDSGKKVCAECARTALLNGDL